MYPFSQRLDENILFQEARFELDAHGRRVHLLTVGGSYEHNTGSLASDFIFTDEDLFGWPAISYLNPVFPDRSVWQHDTGIPGLSSWHHRAVRPVHGRAVATAS